jgi:hypothetical protein
MACAPLLWIFHQIKVCQPYKQSSKEFGDSKSFSVKRLNLKPLSKNSRSKFKILKDIAIDDLTKTFAVVPLSGESNLAALTL